jgi:hypothetical protein
MSRRSAGTGPKSVLEFSRKRRNVKGGRRPSLSHDSQAVDPTIQKERDGLQAENAELRAKAIDLMKQIRALRDRTPD